MKKFLVVALMASLSLVSVAQKNTAALEKKLAKSDLTIADEKKAQSLSTWVDRADLLIEAGTVYSSTLISDMPIATFTALGEPSEIEEVQVSSSQLSKYIYEAVDVYVDETGMISLWDVKKELVPDALVESYNALVKGKEVDAAGFAKSSKVETSVADLSAEFNTIGRTQYLLGNHKVGGKNFQYAFRTKDLRGEVDSMALYFAGICYFEGGDYAQAEKIFSEMNALGANEDGLTQYYLACSLEEQGRVAEAIVIYEEAFAMYPSNSHIMGGLINAYIASNESPEKLISLIEKAQSLDPKNISLYLVESQIWDKIGDREEAYSALDDALAIEPNNSDAHFNYAVFMIIESDALVDEAAKVDFNDTETYDALMARVEELRINSIVKLETCYQINPENQNVITLLRQMYFVCRDYDNGSYQAKYDEFNAQYPAQ